MSTSLYMVVEPQETDLVGVLRVAVTDLKSVVLLRRPPRAPTAIPAAELQRERHSDSAPNARLPDR